MASSWDYLQNYLDTAPPGASEDVPEAPPTWVGRATEWGRQTQNRLAHLPTPGGLGAMFLLLLVLLLVLVPVGNTTQTRLQLMWQVLLGQEALPLPGYGGQNLVGPPAVIPPIFDPGTPLNPFNPFGPGWPFGPGDGGGVPDIPDIPVI